MGCLDHARRCALPAKEASSVAHSGAGLCSDRGQGLWSPREARASAHPGGVSLPARHGGLVARIPSAGGSRARRPFPPPRSLPRPRHPRPRTCGRRIAGQGCDALWCGDGRRGSALLRQLPWGVGEPERRGAREDPPRSTAVVGDRRGDSGSDVGGRLPAAGCDVVAAAARRPAGSPSTSPYGRAADLRRLVCHQFVVACALTARCLNGHPHTVWSA